MASCRARRDGRRPPRRPVPRRPPARPSYDGSPTHPYRDRRARADRDQARSDAVNSRRKQLLGEIVREACNTHLVSKRGAQIVSACENRRQRRKRVTLTRPTRNVVVNRQHREEAARECASHRPLIEATPPAHRCTPKIVTCEIEATTHAHRNTHYATASRSKWTDAPTIDHGAVHGRSDLPKRFPGEVDWALRQIHQLD